MTRFAKPLSKTIDFRPDYSAAILKNLPNALPHPRCVMKLYFKSRNIGLLAALSLSPASPVSADLVSYWSFDAADRTKTYPLVAEVGTAQGSFIGSNLICPDYNVKFIGAGAYTCTQDATNNSNLANGYIQTTLQPPTGTAARSFSIWFKTDTDVGDTDVLWGYGTSATESTNRFDFRLNTVSGVRRLHIQIGSSVSKNWTLPVSPSDGAWHHALLTYSSGGIGGFQLYYDGKLVSTSTATGTYNGANLTSANPVIIGSGKFRGPTTSPNDRDWDGSLDDFGIYSETLTALDAALIHGMGRFKASKLTLLPDYRTLANAAVDTQAFIDGTAWKKVSGLSGTVGTTTGTIAAGNATLVTGTGVGIQMMPLHQNASELALTPTSSTANVGFGGKTTVTGTITNTNTTAQAIVSPVFHPGMADSTPVPTINSTVSSRQVPITSALTAALPSFTSTASNTSMPLSTSLSYQGSGNSLSVRYGSNQTSTLRHGTDGEQISWSPTGFATVKANYFARKLNARAWAVTADLTGVTSLSINDSHSGYGTPSPSTKVATESLSETVLTLGPSSWRVLTRKVTPIWMFPYYQILIVPNDPAITRSSIITPASFSFGNLTTSQTLDGLPASARVHYLWFTDRIDRNQEFSVAFAKKYLEAAAFPGEWAGLSSKSWQIPVNGTTPISFEADMTGKPAGSHVLRWAPGFASTDPWTLPNSAFATHTIEVAPPEFAANRESLAISAPSGTSGTSTEISIQALTSISLAGAIATSDQPWLKAVMSENQPGKVLLRFFHDGIATNQSAIVTITLGQTTLRIPVTFSQRTLNVVRLLADPSRHRCYAIDYTQSENDNLLVINPDTAKVIRSLPIGRKASDIAISPDSKSLYVLSDGDGKIRRIDLDTLREVDSRDLLGWTPRTNENSLPQMVAAADGILYFANNLLSQQLIAFHYPTGSVRQTVRPADSMSVRGIALTHGASRLMITCIASSNSAINGLYSYPILPDGTLGAPSPTPSVTSSNGLAEINAIPAGANNRRLFVSPGGDAFTMKSRIDGESLTSKSPAFSSEVLDLSANGKLIVTPTGLFRTDDASLVRALTGTIPVATLSANQRRLVVFNSATTSLTSLDLSAELPLTTTSAAIPANTADFSGFTLAWPTVSWAQNYNLYLANSAAALATTDSMGNPMLPADSFRIATPRIAQHRLASALPPGSTWFWRADALTDSGLQAGTVRSFRVPSVLPSTDELEITVVQGLASESATLPVTLAAGITGWSAASDATWLTASPVHSPAESLQLSVSAASLPIGLHSATVSLTANGSTARTRISLRVLKPIITAVQPDPDLPRIYAIHEDAADHTFGARLLVINAENGSVSHQVPIGRNATDLALHRNSRLMMVANRRSGKVLELNRDTLTTTRVVSLSLPINNSIPNTSTDVSRVAVGPNGRYNVAGINTNRVHLYQGLATAHLATVSQLPGAMVFSDSGADFFLARYLSYADTQLYKYRPNGSTVQQVASIAQPTAYKAYTTPDAFQTSLDGKVLCYGGIAYDDSLKEIARLDEPVLACSPYGSFVVTPTKVRSLAPLSNLYTLPFTATYAAVSPVSGKLLLFRTPADANQSAIQLIDLAPLIPLGVEDPASPFTNGAVFNATLTTLTWTADPLARSYNIFFGTNATAVANASVGGPLHLGSTSGTSFNLPNPLAPNTTYYWRIDRIGHYGSRTGTVRSFLTLPVKVEAQQFSIRQPLQVQIPTVNLAMTAASTTSWTASTTTPWIQLLSTSGSTPGTLSFAINKASMAAGTTYNGSITITSGGKSFQLPVRAEMFATNYTRIVTDPLSGNLYALNQANLTDTDPSTITTSPAFLVRIDAATGLATASREVGTYATDIAVHPLDDRIYITLWKAGKLLALNRTTLATTRSYDFTVPSNSNFQGDAFKVAAGKRGQVMVEGLDQWITLTLLNTETGLVDAMQNFLIRQGDGDFGGNGSVYWHSESNSSGAELRKYDVSSNIIDSNAPGFRPATMIDSYGSRIIAVSLNGSRIFWNGNMFDETGNSLWFQAQHVLASNATGSQALVSNGILDTVARNKPTAFPVGHAASDGAHNATADKWYYLSGGQLYSATFTSLAAPLIAALDAPTLAAPTPDVSGTYLPVISHCINESGMFQLEFLRASNDDGQPQVECSTDLKTWTPLTAGQVLPSSEEDGITTFQMTVPINTDTPSCFYRVLRIAAPN